MTQSLTFGSQYWYMSTITTKPHQQLVKQTLANMTAPLTPRQHTTCHLIITAKHGQLAYCTPTYLALRGPLQYTLTSETYIYHLNYCSTITV